MDAKKHTSVLQVTAIQDEGILIAECDQVGLVTESDSFGSLCDRVLEIAPELAALNGLEHLVITLELTD